MGGGPAQPAGQGQGAVGTPPTREWREAERPISVENNNSTAASGTCGNTDVFQRGSVAPLPGCFPPPERWGEDGNPTLRRVGGGRITHTRGLSAQSGGTDTSSGSTRTREPLQPSRAPLQLIPASRLRAGAERGSRRPPLCPPRADGSRGAAPCQGAPSPPWGRRGEGRARMGADGALPRRCRHQAREHLPRFLSVS